MIDHQTGDSVPMFPDLEGPRPAGDKVLLYPVHRTSAWWSHVGRNMGWGDSKVVSDLRGDGDVDVVDDFYAELRRLRRQDDPDSGLLSSAEIEDVIARCRVLRWLDPQLARAMAHAMTIAMDRVLERERPRIIASFPIDRYVSDVLERRARKRGIPYVEVTAGVLPSSSMLMYRGALLKMRSAPTEGAVDAAVASIAVPDFVPTYVAKASNFTRSRFLRTWGYFRARGLAFKAISIWRRDPLGLHYNDAQYFLGHKPRLRDMRVVGMHDADWRDRVAAVPRDRRVMIALSVFPEASIDYWLRELPLIAYEDLQVRAAKAFSDAGFLVLVKDHPLQFGFRQTGFLDRLRACGKVVILPYDVPGNELVALSGVSFSCTGTLGLQAALAGLVSVVAPAYYADPQDFVVYGSVGEVEGLPGRVMAAPSADLGARRRRIAATLLQGSFGGDLFSFRGFDTVRPASAATDFARAFGERLRVLEGEGTI